MPEESIVQTFEGPAVQVLEPEPAEGEETIETRVPAGALVTFPVALIVAVLFERLIVYVTVSVASVQ